MASKLREQSAHDDIRRLMKEKAAKKVQSPFARYDPVTSQLSCLICKVPLKNETLWMAHENGRQHQQAVLSAKSKNTIGEPKSSAVKKRPADTTTNLQSCHVPKKPKNSELVERAPELIHKYTKSSEPSVVIPVKRDTVEASAAAEEKVVSNHSAFSPEPTKTLNKEFSQQQVHLDTDGSFLLPENFFDKPTKNVAQKQEREKKALAEDEWAKFQKSIQEESHKSAVIVEHEDETATMIRELDDVQEQMDRWEKIITLEKKKEEAAKKATESATTLTENTHLIADNASKESEDDTDDDLDFLDWRKKSIFDRRK